MGIKMLSEKTMRLFNKAAFVTGAGRGIGRAIAHKFAAEGAAVALAEIDVASGDAACAELASTGAQVLFLQTDITREDDVRRAIEQTVSAFGRLDILVNNAGKNFYYDATTMTEAEWDSAMDVDVKGAWLCSKYAIPHMLAHGGAIVNIASVHARITAPGHFPYAAAKSAVVGLTRSLALDYAPQNIRVNAICPGWVRTDLVQGWLDRQPEPAETEARVLSFQPMGRMGTPEEIANFVAFVASDEASFITGAELVIDGGMSIQFPR
jgi:NAD(P)-dependent dehydrogenase (short-subunit alcohol dehydrogenase family)